MALQDNILAYYKMSSGKFTTDSIGVYTATGGGTQQNLGFKDEGGSGDSYATGTNFGLTGTADMSVSWWIKMTTDITATGVGLMFMDSTLTTDRLIALDYEYNGGTRRLNLYNASNTISASYNTTLGTTWHHIVITRTSGNATVYLDGIQVIGSTAPGTTTGAQNNLFLGTGKAYGGNANEYYDELGVWSRALTAQEVQQLYRGGSGLQYPFGGTRVPKLRPAPFRPGFAR